MTKSRIKLVLNSIKYLNKNFLKKYLFKLYEIYNIIFNDYIFYNFFMP